MARSDSGLPVSDSDDSGRCLFPSSPEQPGDELHWPDERRLNGLQTKVPVFVGFREPFGFGICFRYKVSVFS